MKSSETMPPPPRSIGLMNARTLRPVILSMGSQNSCSEAYWKNIRVSRRRWCSPIWMRLRSAGVSVSSRMATSVSGPAQSVRAFVGPRPNWSLCCWTIAVETSRSRPLPRSTAASVCPSVDIRHLPRPSTSVFAQEKGTGESGESTVGPDRGRAKRFGFRRCSEALLRPWPRPSPAASVVGRMVLTDTLSPARPEADRHDLIRVHGARVNNLKDVSVEIPKRRLTAFTGISGSGKSSLVFGTIAAESQRLINETYSAFVQGFMPTLARPEVDVLDGLTTAIIVDQERMGVDARSTVGTATDTGALLRILFSRLGQPYLGPPNAFSFNVASVKAAGAITVDRGGRTRTQKATFTRTGGMCPRCEGRGAVTDFDLSELYDEAKSLNEGALTIPGYSMEGWYGRIFRGAGFFDPDKPIRKFNKRELHDLLYKEATKIKVDGINLTYEGLIPTMQKKFLSKDPEGMQPHIRAFVERAVTFTTCPDCDGTRLSEAARSSTIEGNSIADAFAMQITDLAAWVRGLDAPSVAPLLTTLEHTLESFVEIGLGYLSLDRPSGTLSGGEAQRTKMIRQLGSSLTDVTYVFDEPTVGLHPHDIQRMNELLLRLRDKGNTVLVVEHKPETIAIADRVVDLGPRAGTEGGEVVFEGTVEGLRASGTITGRHLDDRASLKPTARKPKGALEIRGATAHNLQNVNVDIPLG